MIDASAQEAGYKQVDLTDITLNVSVMFTLKLSSGPQMLKQLADKQNQGNVIKHSCSH